MIFNSSSPSLVAKFILHYTTTAHHGSLDAEGCVVPYGRFSCNRDRRSISRWCCLGTPISRLAFRKPPIGRLAFPGFRTRRDWRAAMRLAPYI